MRDSLQVWLETDFLVGKLQIGTLTHDRSAIRFALPTALGLTTSWLVWRSYGTLVLVSGQARVRGRCDRPRDRFEEVLEWTHGGLIVEQYRTALLNLVPDVRSVVAIGG